MMYIQYPSPKPESSGASEFCIRRNNGENEDFLRSRFTVGLRKHLEKDTDVVETNLLSSSMKACQNRGTKTKHCKTGKAEKSDKCQTCLIIIRWTNC